MGDWLPSAAVVAAIVLAAALAGALGARVWARRRGRAAGTGAPAAPAGAELEAARAQARESVEVFHYSVSHDLRSPIGAILNFTSVLEEDYGECLDDGGRAILARIRRSGEAALALLDALLRFSRIGQQPLRRERVDMEALVREAFERVRGGRAAELSVGSLPPAVGDAQLLGVAFGELLANAVKFSGRCEKIEVAVGGRCEPDGERVYWVADHGVGFDVRYAGKLFRPLERLHSRDDFAGAGIGLAIVRQIVERHGGRTWAEGVSSAGARFFVALPPPGAAP